MLYEYAVEPACLGDWQNFRYVMENFGVSHGRLISQFPKDWTSKVYDVCSSSRFTKRLQLEIELKRIKKQALIRSGRTYDGSLPWLGNAVYHQQHGNPFHAIIVNDASGQPAYVLGVDELSNNCPLWKTKRENKIPRTPADLGNAIHHLLCMSDRILFVDKMYHPAEPRWQDTLIHFIRIASKGRISPRFEYHCEIDMNSLGLPAQTRQQGFQDTCDRCLKDILPQGTKLCLHRWTKWNDNSDFFHARYILTERGGVRIDWGLDSGKPGQRTDVTLLDEEMWQQTWELFQFDEKRCQKSNEFQWIDMVEVENAGSSS